MFIAQLFPVFLGLVYLHFSLHTFSRAYHHFAYLINNSLCIQCFYLISYLYIHIYICTTFFLLKIFTMHFAKKKTFSSIFTKLALLITYTFSNILLRNFRTFLLTFLHIFFAHFAYPVRLTFLCKKKKIFFFGLPF